MSNPNKPVNQNLWDVFGALTSNPIDPSADGGQRVDIYADPSKSVKPTHIKPGEEAPIPIDMLPGLPVDAYFDRNGIIQTGDIPEILPIFLGTRKALAERRIAKAQAGLEAAAKSQNVMGHVAKSILRGKGYAALEDPLRPVTLRDRIAANRLERITHRRRVKQMRATNISNTYPHLNNSTAQTRPTSLNLGEHWNLQGNEKTYARLGSSVESSDDRFRRVVNGPSVRAQKLVGKRDRAVLKNEAIDRALQDRDKRKRLAKRQKLIKAAQRAARNNP